MAAKKPAAPPPTITTRGTIIATMLIDPKIKVPCQATKKISRHWRMLETTLSILHYMSYIVIASVSDGLPPGAETSNR
jgi:hypothetical protein